MDALVFAAIERGVLGVSVAEEFTAGVELLLSGSALSLFGAEKDVESSGSEDGGGLERMLLVVGSEDGTEGPTPFGRPLCFARSANARFMVRLLYYRIGTAQVLYSYQCPKRTDSGAPKIEVQPTQFPPQNDNKRLQIPLSQPPAASDGGMERVAEGKCCRYKLCFVSPTLQ